MGETSARGSDESLDAPQEAADPGTPLRTPTYLTRAQSKVQSKAKALMNRKKTLGKGDCEDIIVDVLYENQRGMFFFGIPKYSSASLLPSDPRPWQNGQFRTSAVDIRNAQVPDPSWEWAWKSWYVDMSRDVDEEGWEYSFAFVGRGGATFAWHGNHPWFHSFVRRRRWLRMRKRKDTVHRTQERAHELTSDYFTIHPKTLRAADLLSRNGSSTLLNTMSKVDPGKDVEKMEIMSIGDLLLALRRSTLDREKIVAVRKFLGNGGEELYYLNEHMEDIMGMLMFQSSRRELLNGLMSKHDELRQEQKELASYEHGEDLQKQQEHDRKARHAANLHKAIHAADEQVKRLEYWSDIRDITDASAAVEAEEAHIEPSFKNKQPATAGTPALNTKTNGDSKGHETAFDTSNDGKSTASKKSSIWYDSESRTTRGSKGRDSNAEGDTEPERFETAPEYPENASQKSGKSKSSKGKGKARVTNLDGVAEEASEEHDTLEELISPTAGARSNSRSVQIVEPVALDSISEQSHGDDHGGRA